MNYKIIFLSAAILFIAGSCKKREEPAPIPTILKDAYASSFDIGVAVNSRQFNSQESEATDLVLKHFNAITAENDMKWQYIHNREAGYSFTNADRFVNFGAGNGLKTIGHTLIWHSQLPAWVHSITDSAQLSNVMRDHIHTVAGRYKGKIYGWDVVNEAFENSGKHRDTVFYKYIGEKYMESAFSMAQEADPTAELYYNDYDMTFPGKREAVIKMIQNLKSRNIRIDAVGMQGHWTLSSPSLQEIESSIVAYANAGVKVMITELDITVLPRGQGPYKNSLPESVSKEQAQRYADIFRLFKKHRDKITRVSVWGVHDGQSWLNDYPVPGRTDHPLLFDRNYKPKACLQSVLEASK